MEALLSLAEMVDFARQGDSLNLVIAAGHDPVCLEAAARAVDENICRITLVGDQKKVAEFCEPEDIDTTAFTLIEESDEVTATMRAVEMVRKGQAQVLMKGMIRTDKYMKCILDRDQGLVPAGSLLSHLAVMEVATYPKLLICSDQAIIPLPTVSEKRQIAAAAVAAAHRLGIEKPKVAFLAATEKVTDRMPATGEAAELAKLSGLEEFSAAILDGPLSLDLAISPQTVAIKEVTSPVAGDADILIFPNIETGNVFYKAATKLANAKLAAIVAGAKAPCVLTSRADDEETKFLSIVFGCMLG